MTLLNWLHHYRLGPLAAPAAGVKHALFYDPLMDPLPIAESGFADIVTNSDGTFSFKTSTGQFISQEPLQHGVFHKAGSIGAYEKFGMVGNVVTSWTRPAEGDPIYSYVLVQLPNAA